jgi:hypothetical protein
MRLPKDGLVEPEERARLIDSEDVEGHRLPTTPPPSAIRRGPGHGGESLRRLTDDGESLRRVADDGDDVEGHRAR